MNGAEGGEPFGPREAAGDAGNPSGAAAMMDLGAFRTHLLALLERIAVALERANEANPIDAINRALAQQYDGDERPATAEDQSWRYR